MESVIHDLKLSNSRKETESVRISDEIRGLKDLIPKALEGQKESTDNRLKELNSELKSLKMLMGQRMNPPATPTTSSPSSYRNPAASAAAANPSASGSDTSAVTAPSNSTSDSVIPKPAAVSSAAGTEAVASLQGRSASPISAGIPPGRAAIPAWQMAAATKGSSSTSDVKSESKEAGAGA